MDSSDFSSFKGLDVRRCLLLQIDPSLNEDDFVSETLQMYLEKITDDQHCKTVFNRTRTHALAELETPITDIDRLQKEIDSTPLLHYRISLKPVLTQDTILVTDLPECLVETGNTDTPKLVLYFESKSFCPSGGEVDRIHFLPCGHGAVLKFKDPHVVHKLAGRHTCANHPFVARPLDIFEYLEEPKCPSCRSDLSREDDADDHKKSETRSSMESSGSPDTSEDETYHLPQATVEALEQDHVDDDDDYEEQNAFKRLEEWPNEHSTPHFRKDRDNLDGKDRNEENKDIENETNAFASAAGAVTFFQPHNLDIFRVSLKYKAIPGLLPEDYKSMKLKGDSVEISGSEANINRTKKTLDDSNGSGEVELDEFTKMDGKLNCSDGKKWIKNLMSAMKIPACLKEDRNKLSIEALSLDAAQEAAELISRSLLPARIKCSSYEVDKCRSAIKNKAIVMETSSGWVQLLGIPRDVMKAVGDIDKELHGRWPRR